MHELKQYEVWFVTGSQHLYGEDTLKQVEKHSLIIAKTLDESPMVPAKVVFKQVLTTSDAIKRLFLEANMAENCIGIVTWMHTFSPAKAWINGLKLLQKPIVHLHTQFNRDIPWEDMDMDFMNLNQSAHGDREFGFMVTRLGIDRKVIVGYYQDEELQAELGGWMRAAVGWHSWQTTKVARFGDNMRGVAVTEGDKVETEVKFGFSVDAYAVGDLLGVLDTITEAEVNQLLLEYDAEYQVAQDLQPKGSKRAALAESARMELGMEKFLKQGGFTAFTTNFENLYGLEQLPGHAVQRLMKKGYGFGGEGDWKTAALLRMMKVMATGLEGGTSFMEDYTYHLAPGEMRILGAHMLEVCETLAADKPSLEIHPLSIGNKADPIRSVFTAPNGPAIAVTLIDLGHRFRMIITEVEVVTPKPLPKLPVARVLWDPKPELKTAAAAWILAGGAHHTVFTQALTTQNMLDFAEIAGIECVVIDQQTKISDFKNVLRWNHAYWDQKVNW